MKRIGLVLVLALMGFACSESVGQMLVDAGNMLADGSVPDAGADFDVTCNKEAPHPDNSDFIFHWAEFEIADPGQTEVTNCWKQPEGSPNPGVVLCNRHKVSWIRGTNTAIFNCGQTIDGVRSGKPVSITVHQ